jgi:hypothetical protein
MPQQTQSPAQINSDARAAIKALSSYMTQPLFSESGLQNKSQITVRFQNVGLVTGFWVQVILAVHNGSAVQINATDFSAANALSNIQLTDFANVTRHNAPGWLFHFLNSAKIRRVYGAAMVRTTGFASPIDYGDLGDGQISCPATIAAGADGTVVMWYYVPVSYSRDDLRGTLYANVNNATAQLLLSLPNSNGVQLAVEAGTDSTQAVFVGNAAGSVAAVTMTNATINVSQCYWDNLPRIGGKLLLPVTDLMTAYEIKNSTLSGLTTGRDFGFQYTNNRDFIATFLVYVNTLATGARVSGADINYLQLLAANLTPVWKITPALAFLQNRIAMGTDFPPGCYYFDQRDRPISTTQFGNMQIQINPITAGTGAYLMAGTEDFALLSAVSTAGSFPT